MSRVTVRPRPEDRLSPRVRRMLREATLGPDDVAGSGAGGRITAADVEDAVRRSAPAPFRASPLVRRLLHAAGVRVADVAGTGPDGRVTRADAADAVAPSTDPAAPIEPAPAPTVPTPSPPPSAPSAAPTVTDGRSETVPLPRVRRVIAETMHRSLQTSAQLTAVVEVDLTRLMNGRTRVRDHVRTREGIDLSPFPLLAVAVCRVLRRHPVLNAEIDTAAGTATYHRDIHLGVAVDTDQGLLVPTVRDAQDLTVLGLARRIDTLAERARAGELTTDDVTPGTFTLTNTGSRGVMIDTPILHPPQVGILATTLIEKRPVVVTDEHGSDAIAIRQMSYLSLTYDHQLVDGADAARFLQDLKHELESQDQLTGVG